MLSTDGSDAAASFLLSPPSLKWPLLRVCLNGTTPRPKQLPVRLFQINNKKLLYLPHYAHHQKLPKLLGFLQNNEDKEEEKKRLMSGFMTSPKRLSVSMATNGIHKKVKQKEETGENAELTCVTSSSCESS